MATSFLKTNNVFKKFHLQVAISSTSNFQAIFTNASYTFSCKKKTSKKQILKS